MKKIFLTTLLALFFFLNGSEFSDLRVKGLLAKELVKRKLVTLQLTDYATGMKYLQQKDFDITGVNFPKKQVTVLVRNEQSEYPFDSDDIEVLTEKEVDLYFIPDSAYHNYEALAKKMKSYADAYPKLASVFSVGKSVENRDILALKISDNVAMHEPSEPAILFNSLHHARELMTPEIGLDIIDYLLTNYGKIDKVTHWVNSFEIWVIPMVNPDGNNRVWTEDSWWRKNVQGGYGIDLNRNYPYKWNACDGSSGSESSETYRGPSPGSEPETKAIMNFVKEVRPIFDISYHSYSELVIYPYGCPGEKTPTKDVVEAIGKTVASSIKSDDNNGTYTAGTAWETLYAVDGDDIDWMYHEYNVIPYVIEVNSSDEGFQPDAEWIPKTLEKVRPGWLYLLDRLDKSGARIYLKNQNNVSLTEATLVVKNKTEDNPENSNDSENEEDYIYKANKDGVFHVVLNPGNYEFRFKSAGAEKIENISIGPQLVDKTVVISVR